MKRNRFIPLLFFSLLIATTSSIAQNPVSWKFLLENAGNGEVNLVARATIQQGWHLYDTNIPDGGPTPTSISFDHISGAQPIGKFHTVDATPHVAYDEVFQMKIGTFDGTVRFVQKLKITDKEAFAVTGDVRAQACDDKTCTPSLSVEFSFKSSDLPSGLVVTKSEDNLSEVSSISLTNVSVDKDLLRQPVIEKLKKIIFA